MSTSFTMPPDLFGTARAAQGVLINCDDAMIMESLPRLMPHDVSAFDRIFFSKQECIDIPSKLGLRIWMRRHDYTRYGQSENVLATQLDVSGACGPEWGKALIRRGSWVVARKDGFDLMPQHIEVLVAFCEELFKTIARISDCN